VKHKDVTVKIICYNLDFSHRLAKKCNAGLLLASTTNHGVDFMASKQRPERREALRALSVSFLGNLLQWYDFALFVYFAVVLSEVFYSGESSMADRIMKVLLIYGVGFIGRPVGGLLLGPLGDKYGRKFLLMLTIALMAIGTLAIGLTPGFAIMGVWAQILLVIGRFLQGISVGGEWAAATLFMVEWAPPNRRGLWGSFQQMSIACGFLVASLFAAWCTSYWDPETLYAWGWRIPFLIGGLALAPFALFMRNQVEETPVHRKAAAAAAAAPEQQVELPKPWGGALRTVAIGASWMAAYYTFMAYTPTWAKSYATGLGGLYAANALWANVITLVFFIIMIPLLGLLSDIVGRKPLMVLGSVLFGIAPWFIYQWMLNAASFPVFVAFQCCLAFMVALFSGPAPTALSEMFHPRQRAAWMAPYYSLAAALGGGFAPAISAWLNANGGALAHSWYVVAWAVFVFVATVTMRESAFDHE